MDKLDLTGYVLNRLWELAGVLKGYDGAEHEFKNRAEELLRLYHLSLTPQPSERKP